MAQNTHTAKRGRTLPTYPVFLASPSQAAHLLSEGRRLIILLRHGQTDWNQIKRLQGREDVPLNQTGRMQAYKTALYFRETLEYGVRYGTVCSSPLSRAADTAAYLATMLSLPHRSTVLPEPEVAFADHSDILILDNLMERDYGKLSGLTIEERRHLFPGGERQAGNVESVPMAAARMFRAFDDMLEVCPDRVILGVTHGGIINAVFSRLTSGEIGTGKTLTVNCSASLVAAGIGSPIPLAYNIQEDGIVSYLRKIAVSGADF